MTNSVLGVRTIQHTNGTDAMTIDTAGDVSMSNRLKIVGAHALVDYGSTNGDTYQAQNGIVTFRNIVENIGDHYDTSTYKFTCPVDGLYQMTFGAISQNNTDAYGVDLYKSDTRIRRHYVVYRTIQSTDFVKCVAGDTLHFATGSITLYEGTGTEMYTYASYSLIYAI